MLKKAKIITTTLLASLLTCSLVWVNQKTSEVVNAAQNVTFPFAKGEDALKYAPTVTGPSTQGPDYWMFYEQKFDVPVDLSSATYLAVEFKNITGNPGLTIGVLSNGSRFGTYNIDGQSVKFADQDGNVRDCNILYDSWQPFSVFFALGSIPIFLQSPQRRKMICHCYINHIYL